LNLKRPDGIIHKKEEVLVEVVVVVVVAVVRGRSGANLLIMFFLSKMPPASVRTPLPTAFATEYNI
jgi:hypothetical protein